MSEKITGYVLLIIGVGIILLAFLNGYGIFSGNLEPIRVISLSGINIDLGQLVPTAKAVAKQELVSSKDISSTANFVLHFILLGFFVNVGAKIADIGTKLLRPLSKS